jgi:uncharacterized protein YijF (DUF1287 family)
MPATRRSTTRAKILQSGAIVLIAMCLSRWTPVRRFYALHAPVWGARGSVSPPSEFAARVVAGARAQVGTVYDASYMPISYPAGDVDPGRGACSDVVVRALRTAGVDLQRLLHEDTLAAPGDYPALAASSHGPDGNIDHRRCTNQIRFFRRHCRTLPDEVAAATRDEWQPGDFVYWQLPGGRLHVGVLSDHIDARGLPLVIHNGGICLEQDCLTDWEIVGHFRYTGEGGL